MIYLFFDNYNKNIVSESNFYIMMIAILFIFVEYIILILFQLNNINLFINGFINDVNVLIPSLHNVLFLLL